MAQQVELAVNQREVMGKATKRLRKAGIIPANIYGHKEAPLAIQFESGVASEAQFLEAPRQVH